MRRLKRTLSCLSAFVLLTALLPLPAAPVFAAGGVDDNKYTVRLSYNDDIQINYQHPDADGWWRGNGDIPIGGATLDGQNLAISQLYCVDATVPFHSYAKSNANFDAGGKSSERGGMDVVPNYVAASPDTLPPALKAHWNELVWLTLNGYSGNPGESNASVSRLNEKYHDLADTGGLGRDSNRNIPWDVALMATKVAVWHFTNPDVAYFGTSFLSASILEANKTDTPPQNTLSGIKHRQFVALAKRLVEDATAYAANPNAEPLALQSMDLAIDGSNAQRTATPDNSGAFYYGPYKITDAGILNDDDLVFLEMTGPQPDAGNIGFRVKDGDGEFVNFDDENFIQRYGESASVIGPAIEKKSEFYIRVSPGYSLNGVSMTALARTTTQAAVDMPVVLVHQDPTTGAQDWNAVQAFIGLASARINATVYGQAVLPLSSAVGRLQVHKTGNGDANGKTFSFRLTYANGNPVNLGNLSIPPPDLDKYFRLVTDGPNGVFQLTAGTADAAFSWPLPLGEYMLTELADADCKVSYSINGNPADGRTASVSLLRENAIELVRFTNTPIPPTPPVTVSVVKYSSEPDASVEGAAFLLEKTGGGYSGRAVVNAHGVAYFPQLPSLDFLGRYTLTEILPPANHTGLSGPVRFQATRIGDGSVAFIIEPVLGGDSVKAYSNADGSLTFAVANTYVPPPAPPTPPTPLEPVPPPFTVSVVKHSDADGVAPSVEGAVFTLAKTDGAGGFSGRAVVNAHGVASFLPPRGDSAGQYTLTEESAPANHTGLSGPIVITVDETGTPSAISAPADRASVLSYKNGGALTLSVTNRYNPPTPPAPSTPPGPGPGDGSTPPAPENPPASPPAPENPAPAPNGDDIHPAPQLGATQEVTPPDKLPKTGGAVGTDAFPFGVLPVLLAAIALSLALRARRRGKSR
jgi:hypothetical protein